MTGRSSFRTQLIVHAVLTAGFLGLVIALAVLGVWPAAVIWAVPTAGMATRVLTVVRLNRLGWWAPDPADRPPVSAANRLQSVVFLVLLAGWTLAAVYFAATLFWPGLLLAVVLGAMSFATAQMLRRRSPELLPGA
ncbi:hypothetical protein [Kribbella sp. DT2]|uniref:hypothetical protein n=1 Tax=Kribbella sp. DT2 TaxID=3393427 RepID=UPI003CEB6701